MDKTSNTKLLALGFAMFSMFFGAGNIVFPLAVGQIAQDQNFFAILGLLITAVGVPFMGLFAITLYEGDYRQFFYRIGRIPGFLVALTILGLLGPFGVIPRCVVVTFSTLQMYFPSMELTVFSVAASILLYFSTYKKNLIVPLLGYWLTPLLIGTLFLIILFGLWSSPGTPISTQSAADLFTHGLVEGYQTMDLLAAFFFSSIIVQTIKESLPKEDRINPRKIMKMAVKASCIGAGLLALVYIGFSYTSAAHSVALEGIGKDQILATIALHTLGPYAGLVVCMAVALACLTTSIALGAVFAQFLQKDVCQDRISYEWALALTVLITCAISMLDFNGIASFLVPILQIFYPGLIILSLVNIAYKIRRPPEPVKVALFSPLEL